jgi:hypothetical protein
MQEQFQELWLVVLILLHKYQIMAKMSPCVQIMSSVTRKVWNVVIRIISDVKSIIDNHPVVYDDKQRGPNSEDGLFVMQTVVKF